MVTLAGSGDVTGVYCGLFCGRQVAVTVLLGCWAVTVLCLPVPPVGGETSTVSLEAGRPMGVAATRGRQPMRGDLWCGGLAVRCHRLLPVSSLILTLVFTARRMLLMQVYVQTVQLYTCTTVLFMLDKIYSVCRVCATPHYLACFFFS